MTINPDEKYVCFTCYEKKAYEFERDCPDCQAKKESGEIPDDNEFD